MKIIEVRDGFIVFEAGKDICLSAFVKIDGVDKSYIAQITQLKLFGEISIASAKILFLFKDNELANYDGTIPDKNAQIESFTQDIISNSINYKKPVIIGKTMENNSNIVIDYSAFDKKMLISVDSPDMNNVLVRNLSKQFENIGVNTVILDTLGIVKSKKYIAGVDFKLPLNTESLLFLYNSCLSDATADSKSVIVEIFKELSEYSKTVPFVPFATLKSIVDDMVENQHVFKLLVLKNKLAKLEKLGYFATREKEVERLGEILSNKCVVIDLSKLDTLFLNRYLTYIYEQMQDRKNLHVLLDTANTVSKKNLKLVLSESNIPVTLITHSKFQYLNDIKNMFDNFVIEPSLANKRIFDIYSSFLNLTKSNIYLLTGEAFNYIPLLSRVELIDEVIEYCRESELSEEMLQPEDNTEEDECSEKVLDPNNETSEELPDSDVAPITEDVLSDEEIVEETTETIEEFEEETTLNSTLEEELKTQEESFVKLETDDAEQNPEMDDAAKINETQESNDIESYNSDEISENNDTFLEVLEPELIQEEDNDEVVVETVPKHATISMTQEEIYSAIEEKSENVLSSVAENFDAAERLNLFDEDGEIVEEPETLEKSHEYTELDLENQNNDTPKDALGIEELEDEEDNLSNSDNVDQLIEEDSLADAIDFSHTDSLNDPSDNESLSISTKDFANESSILEEIESENEYYNDEIQHEESQVQSTEEIEIDSEVDDLINSNDYQIEESEEGDSEESLNENISTEASILPLSDEDFNQELEEIVELDPNETSENDIIVDMSDDYDIGHIDEDVEQQIIEDVDKVYTTPPKTDILDDISDSDLDLIDELNNENNELETLEDDSNNEEISEEDDDYGLLEDFQDNQAQTIQDYNDSSEILERKVSNTPIVPVYDADIPQEDIVASDPIQQGDAVTHAKYGNGVVEKMIKYGSKTLFAINFENLGRRLLDPTLTELKRI